MLRSSPCQHPSLRLLPAALQSPRTAAVLHRRPLTMQAHVEAKAAAAMQFMCTDRTRDDDLLSSVVLKN